MDVHRCTAPIKTFSRNSRSLPLGISASAEHVAVAVTRPRFSVKREGFSVVSKRNLRTEWKPLVRHTEVSPCHMVLIYCVTREDCVLRNGPGSSKGEGGEPGPFQTVRSIDHAASRTPALRGGVRHATPP